MQQHSDPFRPHAKGKTRKFFRIITAVAQNIGVDYAASQYLQPAGVFAHRAASPSADETLHIHLSTRFGEWEMGGAEAGAHIGFEQTQGGGADV